MQIPKIVDEIGTFSMLSSFLVIVGMVKIAEELGKEIFYNYLDKLNSEN